MPSMRGTQSLAAQSRQDSFRWTGASPVPQLITLAQFAEATQVGESTVRQWIHEGIIQARSANGHNIRIDVAEIERVFKPVKRSDAKQRPRQRTVPSQTEEVEE